MKKTDDSVTIKLPKIAAKEIRATADALGVSMECATHVMILITSMRLGVYRTKAEFLKVVRVAEKEFGVRLAAKMPPFVKGGDPDFIARFAAGEPKAKRGKGERK